MDVFVVYHGLKANGEKLKNGHHSGKYDTTKPSRSSERLLVSHH